MLDIQNLVKVFYPGTVNETHAINGISLHINKGDVVSLIGSNGSGKSTLFNLISGTFPLTSGKITLDGKDITHQKEYKRAMDIGRVFQDPTKGTAANMSIEDNMIISSKKGMRWPKFSLYKKGVRERFNDMLKEISLDGRLKDNVGLLSGGQRQALTLLMTVMSEPKILLLDEHTAALDPPASDNIMKMTEDIIKERNLTAMMITHNMKFAIEFGNRLIMMDKGRVILDITGEEKRTMTVDKLVELFKHKSNKEFDEDNALLTN